MPKKNTWITRLALVGLAILLVSGCSQPTATPAEPPGPATPSPTSTRPPPTPSPTALPATATPFQPQPTPEVISVWLAPYLPADLLASVQLSPQAQPAATAEEAAYRLEPGGEDPLSRWVYALVTPFPTLEDGVSFGQVRDAWQGRSSGPFAGAPLWMDDSTRQVFTALWGEPAAGAVAIQSSDALAESAWRDQPAWGIVPFEALEPRWKVLEVDGQSPIHKEFDPSRYPLTVPISLIQQSAAPPDPEAGSPVVAVATTNRDPAKMTVLAMTGVTALVRATAEIMERKGVLYPAVDVRDILLAADITHVSNEVPFARDCPKPDPFQEGLKFCSNPKYMALLEDIDTDVVELTGDHFGDWGRDAMRYTLDLYREHGIPYYGGGYDQEDGRKPLLIEHNGNKLAFIGCNAKGGGYATARGPNPGAIDCKGDWMEAEIARLRAAGYLPIVTTQHFEYYTYEAMPKLVKDFRSWAEAGAEIISGSQAHQPHGFEYYKDTFIHYGLGNLFFDQLFLGVETDKGFIDRHIIYDGRHISTEPLVIKFIDLARPRPATEEERRELLQIIFQHSLW